MVETEVRVDGTSFILSPDENVNALREAIEASATTAGTFVEMRSASEGDVSVLIGPRSRVMFLRPRTSVNSADLIIPAAEEPDWTLTL